MRGGTPTALLMLIYNVGAIGTFVFLTFFDGYRYNAWNWIIAIPVKMFMAGIWPIYWIIIRGLFGLLF
ncbi:hypothetical protein HOC_04577 [Hyphomonas oceanitis SCH89]|uniref:Uncharacterized protein n=1 Tax=Hyphomonas oceanitis SCH89 TaxID=1280953 RepID=A0A059GA77_9PROT|nr:hypothetical protein HOC_04577 [Hyphomonas oceanitis SCH89]